MSLSVVNQAAGPPISVRIASHSPDLSPYRETWRRLHAASGGQASMSFEWTDAMTRSHLAEGDAFRLLEVRRHDETVGFAPLATQRLTILGLPVVALAPLSERYNTHSDLVAGDTSAETAAAVLDALPRLDLAWDLFRMSGVLERHPILSLLPPRTASPLRTQVRGGHASYYLRLPSTYDAYLRDRSAKFRSHLRRTERKLADQGTSHIHEASSPADVERCYEMLLGIERASWKHGHGSAITSVPHQMQFYRELCLAAAAAGCLSLQVLTVDGEPAAYNLGLLSHGSYAYLKTSYDERFKPLGVATILRARLIHSLITAGVSELDFPAEPYEWERQWTDSVRWHKVVSLYGPTAVGRLLSFVDHLRHRKDKKARIEHVDPRMGHVAASLTDR